MGENAFIALVCALVKNYFLAIGAKCLVSTLLIFFVCEGGFGDFHINFI